jgi:glycosyltransferase involved in cell wall biosynthesis
MVVHGPYPPDPRVAREARVARDLGWEVDVLATRQPGQSPQELVDGVRVERLPIAHRWGAGAGAVAREYLGFTALAAARLATHAVSRRYAVVHVHNPPDFLIAAALLPKLLGSRIVFDVHDLAPDMFAMRFGTRPGSAAADRMLRGIERAAARLADAVLTVHEPYRRELVARGVDEAKITVVMNSVDERLLPAARASGGPGGFRIVYQGTITPSYGVELLVEALGRISGSVPAARLEIYGDGDALGRVRERAARAGLDGRVHLAGRFLPQTEVLARIQRASVGVIPNLPTRLNRFALSTKLFEYVALGLPVVAADLPTIREHFDDGQLLFFEPGDAEALASALVQVHADPAAAAARVAAARRRYEAYRWPHQGRRYARVLAGCVG